MTTSGDIFKTVPIEKQETIANYAMGDLRKLGFIQKLCDKKPELIDEKILKNILNVKTFNEDTNKITQSLISKPYKMDEHNMLMNETDRTVVALLLHENIIDLLKTNQHLLFYKHFLQNFCIGDYFDRISFQKQLWIFNEMTYYIKILHNYYLYQKMDMFSRKSDDYRFTKVLTKYSNEYNNNTFIIGLCSRLNCSKKELYKKIVTNNCPELSPIELNRVSVFFQLKD